MARKSRFSATSLGEAPMLTLPCGVYRRLSVEDGDDTEKNSLGNQWKIVLDYMKDKSDLQVVETYTDNGFSGMNYNRPEFTRMMDDLRSGKIRCVIVKDISRLGRHFVSTSELVEKTFPAMAVRLICVNDDYDSADENADAAALVLPFKMILNDSYVKDISRKIRTSINAKMNEGSFIPSRSSIPYGYLRNPEAQTYDVDPEAAPVVLRIFELRERGVKFNDIARQLNEDDIPCPGKLRFMRGITMKSTYENALWLRGTIRKICCDQVYIGNRVYGRVKRDKLGDEKTRRTEEEWQIVENAHQAIIKKDLFDRVQQVNREELENRASFGKIPSPKTDYREIFRGMVFCADCGSSMSPRKGCGRQNARIPTWYFYDCNQYHYSGHSRCKCHYIRQETVMDAVVHLLDEMVEICVDVEELASSVEHMPKVQRYQESAKEHLTSVRTRRMNQETKLEQLLVDLTEGIISRDEYEFARLKYTSTLEKLLQEEHDALVQATQMERALSTTQAWIKAVKQYQGLPAVNGEVIRTLVRDIRVLDGTTVHVNLNFADPFASLSEYLDKVDEVMSNAG